MKIAEKKEEIKRIEQKYKKNESSEPWNPWNKSWNEKEKQN